MRRIIGSLLLLAVLAAPASAGIGSSVGARVESFDYIGAGQVEVVPGYGAWLSGGACVGSCFSGMSNFKTLKSEDTVRIDINDTTGASVKGIVLQKGGLLEEFCGSSGRLPIKGGKLIAVYVSANPCAATPDGVVTTGTVTVKFN